MKLNWLGLYALALLLFLAFSLLFPRQLDLFGLLEMKEAGLVLSLLLLASAYLALMTVFSVTELPLSHVLGLGMASFIIGAFTIKLPHAFGVLLVLPYCYKVRQNTQLLRRPDPGFSSAIAVPSLAFYLAGFTALILFSAAVPEFGPDTFALADPFAEFSTGCKPEQMLDACLTDMVARQTQYQDTLTVCDKYLGAQRESCISQIEQQFQAAVAQTKAAYAQKVPLDSTVAQFYRQLVADQVNALAGSNQTMFKLVFALAGFSLVSGLSGPATLIVSAIAAILTRILMSLGFIKQSLSKEHVFNYTIH